MTIYEVKHGARKLLSTIRICTTLFMARTFGEYRYTYHGDVVFAKYHWRGNNWAFPTEPIPPKED